MMGITLLIRLTMTNISAIKTIILALKIHKPRH